MERAHAVLLNLEISLTGQEPHAAAARVIGDLDHAVGAKESELKHESSFNRVGYASREHVLKLDIRPATLSKCSILESAFLMLQQP